VTIEHLGHGSTADVIGWPGVDLKADQRLACGDDFDTPAP
jgi:hypothetical protein